MTASSRRILAIVLCLASAACGDPAEPRPFSAAFTLATVNGTAPPVLVAATVQCDQYVDGALLNLFEDRSFTLTAYFTLDCSASGGPRSPQILTLSGTYTHLGPAFTLQSPGAWPIRATYTGSGLTGTIPASPYTFPIDLDVAFVQLLPA
jgi:hypothetical protein